MRGCCCDSDFPHYRREWGREYGLPSRAGRGGCGCGCHADEPTSAERRETLRAVKEELEKRLADVDAELGKA